MCRMLWRICLRLPRRLMVARRQQTRSKRWSTSRVIRLITYMTSSSNRGRWMFTRRRSSWRLMPGRLPSRLTTQVPTSTSSRVPATLPSIAAAMLGSVTMSIKARLTPAALPSCSSRTESPRTVHPPRLQRVRTVCPNHLSSEADSWAAASV